jgi:hypothetical protein
MSTACRLRRLPIATPSYAVSYSSRNTTLPTVTIVGRIVVVVVAVTTSVSLSVFVVVRVLIAVFVVVVGTCSTTASMT